jgi:hypothetical protein
MSAEWLALAVAALTFGTSLLGYLQSRENRRKIDAVDGKVEGVHTLVNSQHDDLVNRVGQLTGTLNDAGVQVPETPEPPNRGGVGGS